VRARQQVQYAKEPTVNAAVFRQLHDDIVSCRLRPDERLRTESLRELYQVGVSPIREALMRLDSEGLVVLEQNKGFRVAPVSHDHLQDVTRVRIEVERIALRWAIEKGDVRWEADLVASFHRLSHLKKFNRAQADVNSEWAKEHRAFHDALVSACASPELLGIYANLFAQFERYVALSIMSKAAPRNDVDEHEQIMKAAVSRNANRAIQFLTEHIERTRTRVAKSLGAS
jgi:GntR family transcriptional regulator, carbon starvation induced regulator